MLWIHTVVSTIEFQEVKPNVVDDYNSLPPNTMPEAQSRLQCTTKANALSEGSETSPTAKRGRRLPPFP